MIWWSDDCLACLCNLPHSIEEHNAEVERAAQELKDQQEAIRREFSWIFDDEYFDDEEE